MEACYGGGDVAGAVIGTFFATLILTVLGLFLWKRRKEKKNPLRDLVLVENGGEKDVKGGGGYDNSAFTDELPPVNKTVKADGERETMGMTRKEKDHVVVDGLGMSSKKPPWTSLQFIVGKGARHSFDTSAAEVLEEYSVALKGHDFTGLGFSVGGGLKDGIFVKEVMQRGPAAESRKLQTGDRIRGMWVSFEEVVLPDAVALLSYASPYAVRLEVLKNSQKKEIIGGGEVVAHPSFRSSSATDLSHQVKEIVAKIEDRSGTPLTGNVAMDKNMQTAKVKDRASPSVVIRMEDENFQTAAPPDNVDGVTVRPFIQPRLQKEKKRDSGEMKIVEAISPVVRLDRSKIECVDIPAEVLSHMVEVSRNEEMQIPMDHPTLTLREKSEPQQIEKSKFGIKVLPDLNFGKQSSSPADVKEKRKSSEEKEPVKRKVSKSDEDLNVEANEKVEVVEVLEKEGQRPSSADSAGSLKKKFHIRLFNKSKQYSLEPEKEIISENTPSEEADEEQQPKVRKMEEAELERNVEQHFDMKSPNVEKEEKKIDERGFVSKGLQSLRDFKDKVTQKLSSHDNTSSSDEETTAPHLAGQRKKPKAKKMKSKEKDNKGKTSGEGLKRKQSSGSSTDDKEKTHSQSKGTKEDTIEMSSNVSREVTLSRDERNKDNSSDRSSESSDEDEKPSKPKRSTKRKAPIPPMTSQSEQNPMLITTSAEVAIHPKTMIEVNQSEIGTEETKLKIPQREVQQESKRSASYGDLASPQTYKMDLSDRATSLDFKPTPENHISTVAYVNDLSRASADHLLHLPTSTQTLSSSSTNSTSSETLKQPDIPEQRHENGENESEVVISTSGTSVLVRAEVERVAREAIEEVINKVNGMEEGMLRMREKGATTLSEKKPSRIPVPQSKNQVTIVQEQPKEVKHTSPKKLLRDDSKTRLMQMVADANDIKINRIRNHDQTSPQQPSKTLEITAKELDGIMMSHSDFLAKQATATVRESPPKDTSFDNWIYVDQKLQISSSDPSASSHDDDDDGNDSRNRSPTTFRTETHFDTSELKMVTRPTESEGKVFSTTMTLPQKTVTQIVIAQEPPLGIKKPPPLIDTQLPTLETTKK